MNPRISDAEELHHNSTGAPLKVSCFVGNVWFRQLLLCFGGLSIWNDEHRVSDGILFEGLILFHINFECFDIDLGNWEISEAYVCIGGRKWVLIQVICHGISRQQVFVKQSIVPITEAVCSDR